jgi:hypothetical protein
MLHRHPLTTGATLLILGASAVAAQGRVIDEGTFLVTRSGAPSQTESFRIRLDNGAYIATGQLIAGSRRVSSALTTDTLGTPLDYKLEVRDNGTVTTTLAAITRSGRLSSRSQLAHGDESMREYPVVIGGSLILDDELLHQTFFVTVMKRSGATQVLQPRSARTASVTVRALGLDGVTVSGRSVTGTRYSLIGAGPTRDFWVDASGRLLQVEVPALGLKAVREELPR